MYRSELKLVARYLHKIRHLKTLLNHDCEINTSGQEERGAKKRNGGRGEEDRE